MQTQPKPARDPGAFLDWWNATNRALEALGHAEMHLAEADLYYCVAVEPPPESVTFTAREWATQIAFDRFEAAIAGTVR